MMEVPGGTSFPPCSRAASFAAAPEAFLALGGGGSAKSHGRGTRAAGMTLHTGNPDHQA